MARQGNFDAAERWEGWRAGGAANATLPAWLAGWDSLVNAKTGSVRLPFRAKPTGEDLAMLRSAGIRWES
jgi:hypothetical protein